MLSGGDPTNAVSELELVLKALPGSGDALWLLGGLLQVLPDRVAKTLSGHREAAQRQVSQLVWPRSGLARKPGRQDWQTWHASRRTHLAGLCAAGGAAAGGGAGKRYQHLGAVVCIDEDASVAVCR